ncbi:MAG TPA: ABC transporter ATP-binding protein [Actinomycetota bacterium]|nr:ABC transporter ATP-binding protein [Actinomycetota bacterium]
MSAPAPLLALEHVHVGFATDEGVVSAVSDVSLAVNAGEIFGLVGESGCGKTTLAMAAMGLLPHSASVHGAVRFEGRDLVGLPEEDLRRLRGDRISMVFQDPMTSLDPAFPIGDQVAETIRAHRDVDKQQARARALELLAGVGIPEPERRYGDAPHRLSGGMRQRVVIATALANEPALLLADEPTTALDVTIQSQVLDLLRDLRARLRTTIVLITHDLGVIAQICDRVGVMYAGQLVEVAPVADIFRAPRHPYTQALLAALPSQQQEPGTLRVIPGRVPNLVTPPPGCRFAGRCPSVMDVCTTVPPLAHETDAHLIACWLSEATKRAGAPAGAAAGGAA